MKIVELLIDELDEFLGFEATALVNQPAIETEFYAFKEADLEDAIVMSIIKEELSKYTDLKEEKFESYNDYPESAVNEARKALEWRDSHPDNDCGTRVGWARANQLANRENISEETIARMASFKRHQQHKDVPYSEGCGGLMWSAWGGTAGIEWAQRKLEEIRTSLSDEPKYYDDLPSDVQEKLLDYLETIAIDANDVTIVKEKFAIVADPDAPTTSMTAGGRKKKLYKYTGPSDSKNRSFCAEMMSRFSNKLFRREDISKMSATQANPEFGMYNIFEYKGSFGCRHSWEEVHVEIKEDDASSNYLTRQKDLVLQQGTLRIFNFSIEEDQMIVTGPLMVPDKLILRIDEEGNPYHCYFSEETVRTIAKKMMKSKLLDTLNIEHISDDIVDGYMMENWIIEDSKNDKARFYGFDLPKGTWMGSYKIEDPEVWKRIKEGELRGFSIEGMFGDRFVQQ